MDISVEEREVTKTKSLVTLDNEEFETGKVIEFLESVMGTDGYMSGVRGLSYSEREIANALQSLGLVDHSHSAGWFETDKEKVNELWETLVVEVYDDLDEVNAEKMVR